MNVLEWIALAVAALAALPALILLVECLAALAPSPGDDVPAEAPPRFAVLVPAHNEELSIGGTVASLVPEIPAPHRLIVIADNCSDGTAARAREAGASVIERRDADRRGKGFAIQFGLEHLDADPPDVVVLVDADCRISAGGPAKLAGLAAARNRPIQAEYLLGAPASANPVGLVSALAVLVRNRVRPRGLLRLGLPCQLTGSGMAFPWRVLRDAPETGANLVEDLVMGLDMARRGHPARLCPSVQVKSELPEGADAAMKQRRRWEHGQLQSLLRYGPQVIVAGLLRLRPALIGLGLDLIVPPLAMLVMLLVAVTGLEAALALAGLVTWCPALVAAGALAAVALAVVLGWWAHGRATIPARALLTVPLYLVWKIPLYLALLVGKRQKTWERTDRDPRPPAP